MCDTTELDRLLWEERKLVEWNAFLYPSEDLPLLKAFMRRNDRPIADCVADDDVAAAEFAGLHRGDDPVHDHAPVPAPVDCCHERVDGLRVGWPAPCPAWPGESR